MQAIDAVHAAAAVELPYLVGCLLPFEAVVHMHREEQVRGLVLQAEWHKRGDEALVVRFIVVADSQCVPAYAVVRASHFHHFFFFFFAFMAFCTVSTVACSMYSSAWKRNCDWSISVIRRSLRLE